MVVDLPFYIVLWDSRLQREESVSPGTPKVLPCRVTRRVLWLL